MSDSNIQKIVVDLSLPSKSYAKNITGPNSELKINDAGIPSLFAYHLFELDLSFGNDVDTIVYPNWDLLMDIPDLADLKGKRLVLMCRIDCLGVPGQRPENKIVVKPLRYGNDGDWTVIGSGGIEQEQDPIFTQYIDSDDKIKSEMLDAEVRYRSVFPEEEYDESEDIRTIRLKDRAVNVITISDGSFCDIILPEKTPTPDGESYYTRDFFVALILLIPADDMALSMREADGSSADVLFDEHVIPSMGLNLLSFTDIDIP